MEEKREVQKSEGENYAMENELAFIEASALDGTNIDLAFTTLINCRSITDKNQN